MTVEASVRGRNARRRGGDAERKVVAFLRQNGFPDARRYLAGDGRQPGDLDWHPLVVLEVKDVQSSAWPTWCRQAAAACRAGMVPMVVRRTRGVPDVGLWECRVMLGPWLRATGPSLTVAEDLGSTSMVLVDGWTWHVSSFGAVVSAVAAIDKDDTE